MPHQGVSTALLTGQVTVPDNSNDDDVRRISLEEAAKMSIMIHETFHREVSNASFYGCDDLAATFFRIDPDNKYSIPSKDKPDVVDASLKNGIEPSRIVDAELPYRPFSATQKAVRKTHKYRASIPSPYARKPRVASDIEDREKEGGDKALG